MGKRARPELIEKFRKDIILLKENGIALKDIAEEMKVDEGNLSSYSNGPKKPGEDFLVRFYSIFQARIYNLGGDSSNPGGPPGGAVPNSSSDQPPNADDSAQAFNRPDDRDDHIQTLKLNNGDLRTYLGTVIKNNEILTLNNQKLVDAQLSLIARLDQPNK